MTEEEEKRRTTRHRRRANPATATTSSRSGSTSSLVTTKSVVTAAVVAYGGYQFAQWYWKDTRTPRPQTTTNTGEGNERDEKEDEETERPLEDDLFDLLFHHLPAEEKEKEREEEEQQYQPNATMNPASSSSWLSLLTPSLSTTTTVISGIATMLWGGHGSRSSIGVGGDQGQGQDQAQSYPRPPPQSRRQGIAQCRYQTRVAFQNCLPTIQGVIEQLTETASYTKELKQLRKQKQVRRRRKVQQQQQQQQGEEEKKENTNDSAATATANAEDFDFDEDETDDEELLWCDILIETLTRMMVSSYAYTLLLLSLTVQIHSWHAVGAVAATAEADEASSTATPAAATSTCSVTERRLMRSHQYFLTEGLPLLVNTIRKAIAEEIVVGSGEGSCTEETAVDDATTTTPTCWETPSQHFVTVHDIEQRLYTQLPHVLDDVSGNTRANRQNCHRRTRNRRHRRRMYRRRNWIRFVLPDENTTETSEDTNTPTHEEASSSSSSQAKSPVEPVAVFDPIWDICQSPVWEDAQEQILHSLWYNTLRDGKQNTTTNTNKGWGNLFVDVQQQQQQQQQQSTQEIKQPLATVMARFKKSTSLLFDNDNDDDIIITRMIEKLQKLPTVVELGDVSFH